MSSAAAAGDEPKLIDLRLATMQLLIDRLGTLQAAIGTGNERWAQTNEPLSAMGVAMDRQFAEVQARLGELQRTTTAIHSEVISQANQILNVQHEILALAMRAKEAAP